MQKIEIVTGAAKGIGKAITERLIEDGFIVVAVDVDEESGNLMLENYGEEHLMYACADISDEYSVRDIFAMVMEKYQRIDVLVNNAGIIRDNMIWKMSADDFDAVMNINLRGAWLMCREAAIVMKEQQSGRIVNIASRALLGNRGQSNYSPSKAGLVSLTRVLALELGKYKVCVNAVAPGLIDTPLTQALSAEVREQLIAAQPTREMGRPEDVAHAVAFLVSERTQFITGQTLYVDGGKHIGAGT
jgi:NAD(P)-dependent dehydrogenase (short-subunit alcohol dehydrogenase family)